MLEPHFKFFHVSLCYSPVYVSEQCSESLKEWDSLNDDWDSRPSKTWMQTLLGLQHPQSK